jgi:transcriptional regulator with XRE-family HTH domain
MPNQDPVEKPEPAIDIELITRGDPGWQHELRRLMQLRGVRPFQLAQQLGCDASTVRKWLNKGSRPAATVLRKALSALGVPKEELARLFGKPKEDDAADIEAEIDAILAEDDENEIIGAWKIFKMSAKMCFAKLARRSLQGDTKSTELFFKLGGRLEEQAKSMPAYRSGRAAPGAANDCASIGPTTRSGLPFTRSSTRDEAAAPADAQPPRQPEPEPQPSLESRESVIRYDQGIPGPSGGEPFGEEKKPAYRGRGRFVRKITFVG